MSIAADHVGFFRVEWAERLTDRIRFTTIRGRGRFNRTTKQYEDPVSVTHYEGPCLIRPHIASVRPVPFGETESVRLDFMVYADPDAEVPVGAAGIVTDTRSDPQLVGLELVVRGVWAGSYRTVTQIGCDHNPS